MYREDFGEKGAGIMSTVSSVYSQNRISYADYGNFASGKKINSAADGAAELSIIQKEESQIRGTDAGTNNIASAQDMLKVSDGALSQITDNLQRMRELAVQASNTAVMTDADRSAVQMEIDQLKQGISDIASQTSFNTKNILDGSKKEFNIATDANGGSMQVSTGDATLKALGIADFDVTGDFDISDIDEALASISSTRSSGGAQMNALSHAYNNNTNYLLNTTGAKSRLEDLDFPEAISDLKKKETLQQYQFFMQRKQTQEEEARMFRMFM